VIVAQGALVLAGILMVLYSREFYARNGSSEVIGLNATLDARCLRSLQLIDQSSWLPWSVQLFLKRR
jgi:hypothetical protein